ncbi:MAG: XRE family transcriptional regulator [Mesorhizobium sp.]|jgi:HTH-type transcriptional regulator/antitoxin HigA|nr:XRE family transcriptional regulator [Mesorhizobium sp.]
MDIRPIHTEADLQWALREVEPYFDKEPQRGTPEGDRFEVLLTLIEAYEDKHYPIGIPEPGDFLASFMEMTGKSKADLIAITGSDVRADDILSGHGGMTLEIAYRLNAEWNVPADVLLRAGKAAA